MLVYDSYMAGGASSRGPHFLQASAGCELSFGLRHHAQLMPPEPEWRLRGTLVHEAMAHHYGAKLSVRPDWLNEPLEEALRRLGGTRTNVIDLAKAYAHWYADRFRAEAWAPAYVEEEFSLEHQGQRLTCRTDLVTRLHGFSSELWIVDFKTTKGEWNGKFYEKELSAWPVDDGPYRMSWQAIMNLHIVRRAVAPIPVAGFLIRRLKTLPPFDADTNEIRINALPYDNALRTAVELSKRATDLQNRLDNGYVPLANYALCHGAFGPCDYIHLCDAPDVEERRSRLKIYKPSKTASIRTDTSGQNDDPNNILRYFADATTDSSNPGSGEHF